MRLCPVKWCRSSSVSSSGSSSSSFFCVLVLGFPSPLPPWGEGARTCGHPVTAPTSCGTGATVAVNFASDPRLM